jgi:hypothetical protein
MKLKKIKAGLYENDSYIVQRDYQTAVGNPKYVGHAPGYFYWTVGDKGNGWTVIFEGKTLAECKKWIVEGEPNRPWYCGYDMGAQTMDEFDA